MTEKDLEKIIKIIDESRLQYDSMTDEMWKAISGSRDLTEASIKQASLITIDAIKQSIITSFNKNND